MLGLILGTCLIQSSFPSFNKEAAVVPGLRLSHLCLTPMMKDLRNHQQSNTPRKKLKHPSANAAVLLLYQVEALMRTDTHGLPRRTFLPHSVPPIVDIFLGNVNRMVHSSVAYARMHFGAIYPCNVPIIIPCRKVYASGSSLSTRRTHLQSDGHIQTYLDIVTKHGLENKLPTERRRQAEEQRAKDLQRIPFSMKAFSEQLMKVFVANDLVCLVLTIY